MTSIIAIDNEHNAYDIDGDKPEEQKIKFPVFTLSINPGGGTRMDIALTNTIDEIRLYSEIYTRILRLKENDEVHVYLHTSGGSVLTALGLCYAFNQSKARIIGHASGKVISAGTMILAFCDQIEVASDAIFLVHISHGMVYAKSPVLRDHGDARANTMAIFFRKMLDRGMITKEEYVDITEHDTDVYISGETVRQRLCNQQQEDENDA